MHRVQKILLHRLLKKNKQKYSTLTSGYTYDDNVLFHLKQLINNDCVEKKDGFYYITAGGVKRITCFDLSNLEDTGFKTFFFGFIALSEGEYLLKAHLTEASNFYNLPSGKPRFGETVNSALTRSFFENTGLELDSESFSFISLHLKTVKTSKGDTLFDDAFAIYVVNISESQKKAMNLEKNIRWFTLEEINTLENTWPEVNICIVQKDHTGYMTYEFVSEYV